LATETVRETLTPEDVETKTFTPVRLREGYDMAEVDHFLDEVVATLRKLDTDTEGLRREAARNSPGLGGGASANGTHDGPGAAGAPVTTETTSDPDQAVQPDGRVDRGRMTATEATSAAVRVLQMAQDEAERIRADAATSSEDSLRVARERAAELEEQTRAQAARVTAESQQRAAELDEVTRSRRIEMFSALEAERARLSTDVEGLRAFEREYRVRLRTYFTDQVTRLDAERSPAAGIPTEGTPAAGIPTEGTPAAGTQADGSTGSEDHRSI